jgi:hypothetical protein
MKTHSQTLAKPATSPSAPAGSPASQEFYLLDRSRDAINVRFIAAGDETAKTEDHGFNWSSSRYRLSEGQDVFDALLRICESGACEDVTLVCDAASIEACRRAASLEPCTRVVLSPAPASLVLRLAEHGARRLRCAAR